MLALFIGLCVVLLTLCLVLFHHANSVLGVFHQLSPPLANIKADKLFLPIISALNSNSPLPTDVPPGLKRVALKEGVLCRHFRLSSSLEGHLQLVIPVTLKQRTSQKIWKLNSAQDLAKAKKCYY